MESLCCGDCVERAHNSEVVPQPGGSNKRRVLFITFDDGGSLQVREVFTQGTMDSNAASELHDTHLTKA